MLEFTKNLKVLKNQLRGEISIHRPDPTGGAVISEEFVIDGVAIKIMIMDTHNQRILKTAVFLSFYKCNTEDTTSYRLNFKSIELAIDEKNLLTFDREAWYFIVNGTKQLDSFDVHAIVEATERNLILSAIHDDTELTDFELVGTDGTVRVHRAVLAAASPVLRRMLSGEWREAASGRVELPDTTRETLQHLKDFIYLDVLPESGLRPLLLLAACYMMPELEDRCVQVLADGVTSETSYELLEFAFGNKLTKLVIKIMERVECGKVKIADMNSPSETSITSSVAFT